jgi:hypothetical protein
MAIWVKDPGDLIWFRFDFTQFIANSLQPADTIASHTVSLLSGSITLVQHVATSTAVSLQVSGGASGSAALVQCTATTSSGNVYYDEKTIYIQTRVEVP